jgi:hypothetical protein
MKGRQGASPGEGTMKMTAIKTGTEIQVRANYDTKRLARELGVSRAELSETLRNNGVRLHWRADLHHWEIVNKSDVAVAIEFYNDDHLNREG